MSKKDERVKAETARRIAAGDTSKYVQESAKQFGLTVPTKTTYNPNKISRSIQETPNLSGRDAHIANQAFRAQEANNKKIQKQMARRRAVEEAFHRNGSVSKGDFTGHMGDGFLGLNIGATPTGKPKLREGLTSDEYHEWMRELSTINRPMMEQIFPWGSGKRARQIFTPAPLKWMAHRTKSGIDLLANPLKEKISNIMTGIGETKFIQDAKALPSGVKEDVTDMFTIGDKTEPILKKNGIDTIDLSKDLSLDMTNIKKDKINQIDNTINNINSGKYLADKFGVNAPNYINNITPAYDTLNNYPGIL